MTFDGSVPAEAQPPPTPAPVCDRSTAAPAGQPQALELPGDLPLITRPFARAGSHKRRRFYELIEGHRAHAPSGRSQ